MSEKEEGFFQIPYQRVSRDDIRARLEEEDRSLSDEILSDEFMQEVANKMGDSLVNEAWWETLGLAVEMVCDSFGVVIENGEEK